MLAHYTAPRAVGRRFELGGRGLWSKYASAGVLTAQKLHHADVIGLRCRPAGRRHLREIAVLFSPLEQSKRRGRGFRIAKAVKRGVPKLAT